MARLRHKASGVVAEVSDETARRLQASEWEPAEAPKKAPAKKAAASNPDEK